MVAGTEPKQRLPYVSVMHRAGRAGYTVAFPDVPGCTASGRTVDQAMRNARVALDGHLADLRVVGKQVPEPRDFHAVIMSTDSKGAIAFILV
jgi:predicted RNase H-like HicB family nuclease